MRHSPLRIVAAVGAVQVALCGRIGEDDQSLRSSEAERISTEALVARSKLGRGAGTADRQLDAALGKKDGGTQANEPIGTGTPDKKVEEKAAVARTGGREKVDKGGSCTDVKPASCEVCKQKYEQTGDTKESPKSDCIYVPDDQKCYNQQQSFDLAADGKPSRSDCSVTAEKPWWRDTNFGRTQGPELEDGKLTGAKSPGQRCDVLVTAREDCGNQPRPLCEAKGCCYDAEQKPGGLTIPACFKAKLEAQVDSSKILIPLMPADPEELQWLRMRMAAGEYAKCPQLNCEAFNKNCTKYKHRDNVKKTSCASYHCGERDFDTCCMQIVEPTPAPTPQPTQRPSPTTTTDKPAFNWRDGFAWR